jgi:hypothetical protein
MLGRHYLSVKSVLNLEVCDVGKDYNYNYKAQECYAEHEFLVVQAPFLDAF